MIQCFNTIKTWTRILHWVVIKETLLPPLTPTHKVNAPPPPQVTQFLEGPEGGRSQLCVRNEPKVQNKPITKKEVCHPLLYYFIFLKSLLQLSQMFVDVT